MLLENDHPGKNIPEEIQKIGILHGKSLDSWRLSR